MQTISLSQLALAFIPASITVVILFFWTIQPGKALYAIARMLLQLSLIGYLLTYIFLAQYSVIILLILLIMLLASSWISLGVVPEKRTALFKTALFSILIGGGLTLMFITQGVLTLSPWYQPQIIIPIAGMIFSQSMTSISLAAERFQSELAHHDIEQAQKIAMQAAMIPVINSLMAVGVVSLPGMMTGQILSGVSPLIAVRYQIMVMCMIFGAAGITSAIFLQLSSRHFR